MSYTKATAAEVVLMYLKEKKPATASTLAKAVGKSTQSVYSTLYKLKKEGKVISVSRGVWAVPQRTPSKVTQKKAVPEKDAPIRHEESKVQEERQYLLDQLEIAHKQLRDYKDKYAKLHAIASYLEKRNGQLLAHVWEKGGDISIGVN